MRERAAVQVPPWRGPASSVKGYVSFGAANPPARQPLPHNRTAAAQRGARPTVSKAVSHRGSRLREERRLHEKSRKQEKRSQGFSSRGGGIGQSLDREVAR